MRDRLPCRSLALAAATALLGVASASAAPLPVNAPLPPLPSTPAPPPAVPSLPPAVPAVPAPPSAPAPVHAVPAPAAPLPAPVSSPSPSLVPAARRGGTVAPVTIQGARPSTGAAAIRPASPSPARTSGSHGARSRAVGAERHEPSPRRLRRLLRRYRACVSSLPRLERRVLVLRAGLNGQRPRSRAQVAERYDLSTARVGRLERRGLRQLRSGCANGSPATAISPAAAPARTSFTTTPGAVGSAAGAAGSGTPAAARGGSQDQQAVKGERANGTEPAPAPAVVRAPMTTPAVAAATYLREGDGPAHTLLVVASLLAALASAALIVREFRKIF